MGDMNFVFSDVYLLNEEQKRRILQAHLAALPFSEIDAETVISCLRRVYLATLNPRPLKVDAEDFCEWTKRIRVEEWMDVFYIHQEIFALEI